MENGTTIVNTASVESQSRKNLVLGRVFGGAAFALILIAGLFLTPWLLDALGTSQYALYMVSGSVISFFAIDIVLSAVIERLISSFRNKGDEAGEISAVSAFSRITFIIGIIAAAIFVALYFCAGLIYRGLLPSEIDSLKIVFLILAVYSFFAFSGMGLSGIISTHEGYMIAKLMDLLGVILYFVTTYIAVESERGLYLVVGAMALCPLVVILAKFLYAKTKLKIGGHPFKRLEKGIFSQVWKSLSWIFALLICSRLSFAIMPSILGIMSDSTNIAFYSIVSVVETGIYLFSALMIGIYLPKANGLQGEELENLAIRSGRIQLVVIGWVIAYLLSVGQDLVLALAHSQSEFAICYYGLILVTVYQLVNIPQIVLKCAMLSNEKTTKHLAYCASVNVIFSIAISVALSCFIWGVIGIFVGLCAGSVIEQLMLNYFYHKDLGVSLKRFFASVYLRFLPAFIASLGVGFLIHFVLSISYMSKALAGMLATLLVYLVIQYIFIPKEDKKSLDEWFKESWDSLRKISLRKLLPAVSVGILVLGCFTGLAVVFTSKTITVSGTYTFSYFQAGEVRKIEQYRISINNTLIYTTFGYDEEGNEFSYDNPYTWVMRTDYEGYEKNKDLLPFVSNQALLVYDSEGQVFRNLFYVDGSLYSRSIYEEYGGEQICYAKEQ